MRDVFSSPISERNSKNRILLVEDNDTLRQLLGELLSSDGYEVLGINDGAVFFSTLTEFRPDVVLLDLRLPNVNGYSILLELQNSSEWQDVPVIVLSAMSSPANRERAIELGARRYLVKPVALEQIRQVLRQYL